jgi:fumarylacetoacetate (FAA) hydrolase
MDLQGKDEAMKLASYADGTRDGQLWLVSRDLSRAVSAVDICPTLLAAVEDWDRMAPLLAALSDRLNAGSLPQALPFEAARCLAPLPRAPQWLDGSMFLNHGQLMDKAFGTPPIPDMEVIPLVYQGASDDFRGPVGAVEFPSEDLFIDMEGEFGVITGAVPMGASPEAAQAQVRLLVQINDWSLRKLGPREMRNGFGFVQAKPATAFAPVAITPDELGDLWSDGRIKLALHVWINGREVGRATGGEMHFPFGTLIAHCAATRHLSAGTVLGSGTVSNAGGAAGSSCISEIRVIEQLATGAPVTPFLSFGDRVRMEARMPDQSAPFGACDHLVVPL